MSFVEVKQKKKRKFWKQFVRIKKNLLTEPTKYGLEMWWSRK